MRQLFEGKCWLALQYLAITLSLLVTSGCAIHGVRRWQIDQLFRLIVDRIEAPFDWAGKAGAVSIMGSCNKINGPYAFGNHDTPTTFRREQIGFEGFVASDWYAVHPTDFIDSGTDHANARTR